MKVVAWRGNAHAHLENTVEAVASVPPWVTWVEIDTRLTSDGVMVAYHSPTMRVHGDPRGIDDISFKELSQVCLRSKKREYAIPRVADLLTEFPNKEFLFHVKREADVAGYLEEVRRFSRPSYFHSNSESHLEALCHEENSLGVFKSIYTPAEDALDYVYGYMLGHKAFMPVTALEDEWLAFLRALGKKLLVFAGVSEGWMREVLTHDVDGFLTSRFDRAARVLGWDTDWDASEPPNSPSDCASCGTGAPGPTPSQIEARGAYTREF